MSKKISKNNDDNHQQQSIKPKYSYKRIIFWLIFITVTTFIISDFLLSRKYQKSSVPKIQPTPKIITDITQDDLFDTEEQEIKTTIEDKGFSRDIKISELEDKFQFLEEEINQIKISQELPNIILSFSELRFLIEEEKDYNSKISELSALVIKDQFLSTKLVELRDTLSDKNYQINDIKKEFNNSIDALIALKSKSSNNSGFFARIKSDLMQLIVVRRVDGQVRSAKDKIDLSILKIEKYLEQRNYKKALSEISKLDKTYQNILTKTSNMLESQIKIQRISLDIFSYLKTGFLQKND